MNVAVLGLWHLGCVTAACCAEHFSVVGIDFDEELVRKLKQGQTPLFEPGLEELISRQLEAGTLSFSSDICQPLAAADVLWVCDDTPVDEDDVADNDFVLRRLEQCLPHLPENAIVLISSQLPVGTCTKLEARHAASTLRFACSPENLRLGNALETFRKRDRIIAGVHEDSVRAKLRQLFAPFAGDRILWMTSESAEMTKHATNAFLALSVTFANEIARLCGVVGADASEVEIGLLSDARIGPKAYLHSGAAFAGGTLARDVVTLAHLSQRSNQNTPLTEAILPGNEVHKQWPLRQLEAAFPDLNGIRVSVLGLTYKPGTNTLRRSSSVELCSQLLLKGCKVGCYDPVIKTLPESLAGAILYQSLAEAIANAEALLIMTPWPEITGAAWSELLEGAKDEIVIIDVNHAISIPNISLGGRKVRYVSLGRQ
jgi:UDPglucose 6-dehydrogenase